MSDAKEIKVLLSPKTNEILRIGLMTKFQSSLEDSYFKNEKLVDEESRSSTRTGYINDEGRRAKAAFKAQNFLNTEEGKRLLEQHIQEKLQEMQLDHAFRAFKKSNPWYFAVGLNLLASAIGALAGPSIIAYLANWAVHQ